MRATDRTPRHDPPRAGGRAAVVLLGGPETGGRLAIVELALARGAALPRHRHHWEDEALYALAGELAVWCGGEWHRVPAGTAILLPRGVEHGVAVVTGRAGALAVLTPAGFEGFYRDTNGVPPDLERLVATAARYGCEITGPAPQPPPGVARTAGDARR